MPDITFVSLTSSTTRQLQSTLTEHKGYSFSFSNTSIDTIDDLNYDVVVSPANSFGGLKGGIDMRYYLNLGKAELQKYVFDRIKNYHAGEILVGSSALINLRKVNPKIKTGPKYLLLCPTMTVPGDVSGTRNAYLYTRAMIDGLRVLKACDKSIRTVLCPIPCVGVGCMKPKIATFQMETAFAAYEGTGLIHAIFGHNPGKYVEFSDSFDQNMKIAHIQLINGR